MFYLNSTLNFGIPPALVFQLEVCYKVDRLLTGLTAQPKGTTAQWYSNKTSLYKRGEKYEKCLILKDLFKKHYFEILSTSFLTANTLFLLTFRDVLFEYHRAVVPFG